MEIDAENHEEDIVTDPHTLLKRFYALQAERVESYVLFDEGFKAYLRGAPNYNFNVYRQLVHEITEAFKKISQDVIEVKNAMANKCNLNQIANIMDQIQEEEKSKLELTAKLQIAQQNAVDHPSEQCYAEEISQVKQSLSERMQKINEYLEELKYESEDFLTSDDNS